MMTTKAATIVLRVSSADKAKIRDAAERLDMSLTTFITEAALQRAQQTERRPATRGAHGGVPIHFRAQCAEAARGGANGYFRAAVTLSRALGGHIPNDLGFDEWEVEVEKLKRRLAEDDDEGVWRWFKLHYPKMMKLVPTRRRDQFVAGVKNRYQEHGIEI